MQSIRCGLLLPIVVCVSVSVCLLVTTVSPTKTAEAIEVLFRRQTWVGSRYHVLGGGPDPPLPQRQFLEGGLSRPIVKYRKYPKSGRYGQYYLVGGSGNGGATF